jgi:hypothetical protein
MRLFNEGTTATIQVRFRGADGASVTPSTFRYRIDCRTTGAVVVNWTTASAAVMVPVTVTASQMTIQNRGNEVERKVLTIQADAGLSTAFTDKEEFDVLRMEGF